MLKLLADGTARAKCSLAMTECQQASEIGRERRGLLKLARKTKLKLCTELKATRDALNASCASLEADSSCRRAMHDSCRADRQ